MCDNYRIDMTHATFGTCKCGFPKSAHKVTTKAGANAKKIVSSLAPAGDKEKPGRPQASLLQKKAAAEESEVRAIRRFFLGCQSRPRTHAETRLLRAVLEEAEGG